MTGVPTSLPKLVVTGASGFVGRRLLEGLLPSYRILGVDRISRAESGVPEHPNLTWAQVDLAEKPAVRSVFDSLRDEGGADYVIHLAAFYDFTGEDHPEYQRTNIEGTENLLEASRGLGLRRFVFASSVAACDFPKKGNVLTETTPPDGDHRYAVTKRIGEEMTVQANEHFPTVIVRFAALFSDWCEYAPLYQFIETWLSGKWNARILGGKGRSAVPYLHVRDLILFLARTLEVKELDPGEVLIASPDGSTSHRELFKAAVDYYFRKKRRPFCIPRPIARLGILGRWWVGRALGRPPFERPWMGSYIDLDLRVDARRTRERLGWAPRKRLAILRRLPFLIENRHTDPIVWYQSNLELSRGQKLRPNLQVFYLLERHEDEISERLTRELRESVLIPNYQGLAEEDHAWHHRLILHSLGIAVRTNQRVVFRNYCFDLGKHRADQGFTFVEVRHALQVLDSACIDALDDEARAAGLQEALRHLVSWTIAFGIDGLEEAFESHAAATRSADVRSPPVPEGNGEDVPSWTP